MTAGLTLAPAPAVATVRQESYSVPAPTVATVSQKGAFSAPPSPTVRSHKGAADYITSAAQILASRYYIRPSNDINSTD